MIHQHSALLDTEEALLHLRTQVCILQHKTLSVYNKMYVCVCYCMS